MSLYLIINIASISIPFIYTFHPRIKFYEEWKALSIGTLIVGSIFIFWDILFTKSGVWGFNPAYLSGIYFLGLPVEEWLFFICVPYASIFTHYSLIKIKNFSLSYKVTGVVTILLLGFSLMIAVIFHERMYTFVTFLLSIPVLIIGWIYFRDILRQFYLSYLVVLIPFFIVNGILTGSFIHNEIVWYNNNENMGIRLFTIPIEDSFYGFNLLFMNVMIMEFFKRKVSVKEKTFAT